MNENIKLSNCPFCQSALVANCDETLHRSGYAWTETDGVKHYVDANTPTANQCWEINCPEIYGGCGANLSGDSLEEVVAKWNTRS